jgi:hypothetical protein
MEVASNAILLSYVSFLIIAVSPLPSTYFHIKTAGENYMVKGFVICSLRRTSLNRSDQKGMRWTVHIGLIAGMWNRCRHFSLRTWLKERTWDTYVVAIAGLGNNRIELDSAGSGPRTSRNLQLPWMNRSILISCITISFSLKTLLVLAVVTEGSVGYESRKGASKPARWFWRLCQSG